MNPLLDFSGLPRFAEFTPDTVTPALDQLLAENRTLVENLRNQDAAPDWDTFVAPLDDANECLGAGFAHERGYEQPAVARRL